MSSLYKVEKAKRKLLLHLRLHVQFTKTYNLQKKQKYNFIKYQIEINIYLSLHTMCKCVKLVLLCVHLAVHTY